MKTLPRSFLTLWTPEHFIERAQQCALLRAPGCIAFLVRSSTIILVLPGLFSILRRLLSATQELNLDQCYYFIIAMGNEARLRIAVSIRTAVAFSFHEERGLRFFLFLENESVDKIAYQRGHGSLRVCCWKSLNLR